MDKKNIKNGFAFTLAEVLIVMGIIGIIAEMTIPTIIEDFQKQTEVISLKKFYTSFNQILITMASANGCNSDLVCTGLFASGGSTTTQTLGDELVKYVKTTQICGTSSSTPPFCQSPSQNLSYDGTGTNYTNANSSTYYKFVTMDGMSISVVNYSNGCSTPTWGNNLGYMTQTCGYIMVDVNGLKKPNALGRDIFTFYITNGKGALLYPKGGADSNKGVGSDWWNASTPGCTSGGNNDGDRCAGRIIEENWQMTY